VESNTQKSKTIYFYYFYLFPSTKNLINWSKYRASYDTNLFPSPSVVLGVFSLPEEEKDETFHHQRNNLFSGGKERRISLSSFWHRQLISNIEQICTARCSWRISQQSVKDVVGWFGGSLAQTQLNRANPRRITSWANSSKSTLKLRAARNLRQ